MKSFHSGVICPQNPNLEGVTHAPHFEQATGQAQHCREIPFTPYHSQGPGSFRGLDNFFMRRAVAELRDVKIAQFFGFLAYFPHTKPLQKYLPVTSLQARVTSQNDYDFSMWQSKVQRGAFPQRSFPATSGRGAGTPKLAQSFAYGKWLYPYRMLGTTRRVRSGPLKDV